MQQAPNKASRMEKIVENRVWLMSHGSSRGMGKSVGKTCVTAHWNVFGMQMIERFVRGDDATSCPITLTTCFVFAVLASSYVWHTYV